MIQEKPRRNTKMWLVIFRGISWIILDFSAYLVEQADEKTKTRQSTGSSLEKRSGFQNGCLTPHSQTTYNRTNDGI